MMMKALPHPPVFTKGLGKLVKREATLWRNTWGNHSKNICETKVITNINTVVVCSFSSVSLTSLVLRVCFATRISNAHRISTAVFSFSFAYHLPQFSRERHNLERTYVFPLLHYTHKCEWIM